MDPGDAARRVAVVCLLVLAKPARAQLLTNPSFEANFQAWSQPSTNQGVQYSVHTGGVEGVRYAVVSNRLQVADAPRQNISAALAQVTSGSRFAMHFSLLVSAPSSVRAWLQYYEGPALRSVILAERMVDATGQWIAVRGRRQLTWQQPPTNALVYFEVGLPAESNAPWFALDAVNLSPDADGDGLADAQETNSNPWLADSDSDGLPDEWEFDFAFSNGVDEAALDSDGDTFDNRTEYWCATHPRDRWSFPGRPSDLNASSAARAVLDYLALLPARTNARVLMGQHCSYPTNEFTNFITRLGEQTGHEPALLSLQYDDGAQPLQVSNANAYAQLYWSDGGLVLIKWQPRNPWNLQMPQATNHASVDLTALLDPTNGPPAAFATNLFAHTHFMDWVKEAADGLDALQSNGVVVLWRPMSEMNGGWFWHGKANRAAWISIWRFLHQYFTAQRGLHNVIWVYESDQSVHPLLPADYYYPGDDVVDVMGHNLYDDDWHMADDLQALYRPHGKVYAFPQAGPATLTGGTWSNTIMSEAIHAVYPRCSFLCAWNSFTTSGNTYYAHNAIADNPEAQALMDDPWSVDKAALAWTNHLQPAYTGISEDDAGPLVTWRGGVLQTGPDLAIWSDVAAPTLPLTNSGNPAAFFRTRE